MTALRRRRRKKRYRPKPVHVPMAIKAELVIGPVEKALSDILRTGYTDEARGRPALVHRGQGLVFDLPGALDTLSRLYAQVQPGTSTRPLDRLGAKLAADMPLMESDLTGALSMLSGLRPLLTSMAPQD